MFVFELQTSMLTSRKELQGETLRTPFNENYNHLVQEIYANVSASLKSFNILEHLRFTQMVILLLKVPEFRNPPPWWGFRMGGDTISAINLCHPRPKVSLSPS